MQRVVCPLEEAYAVSPPTPDELRLLADRGQRVLSPPQVSVFVDIGVFVFVSLPSH